MTIKATPLEGLQIILEPFAESHREDLCVIAQDPKIWEYAPTQGLHNRFDAWFDKALENFQLGAQLPFVVRRKIDKKLIGSTRFYKIDLKNRRLAIGYTWYIPEVWGTIVNPECKYLLLKYAFENLKINRVVFHVDSRNLHSRAAVKKLGATQEGILRQHMILDDGYIRDTVIFSIIQSEWPKVKAKLKQRIELAAS